MRIMKTGPRYRYRRVDGMAVLALLSCVLVILFESVFMFELYAHVPEPVLSFLRGAAAPDASMESAPEQSD